MKVIIVPAFRQKDDPPEVGSIFVRELLGEMEKQGVLDGVEIDVDVGEPRKWGEDSSASMPENMMKRVKLYCDGLDYDAIVTTNGGDYGFDALRTISKIPLTGLVHSAAHAASLIGDRFTISVSNDKLALSTRLLVERYGLGHKLAAVRVFNIPNPQLWESVRTVKKGERGKNAQGDKIIGNITEQFIKGIEEDRSDALVLTCPHHSCFADEVRQRLDEKGYDEIPIVLGVPSAVMMARTLVNMRLRQSRRAYPGDELNAIPAFR